MSQEKVDKYKKEKANRKKTLARNKVKHVIGVCFGWVVLALVVGWAGYSGYNYYEDKKPAETYHCDTTAIDDYLSGLKQE